MDCGLQTSELDFVHAPAPGGSDAPPQGTWVPDDNDGSSLLDSSKLCTELKLAQLPGFEAQRAQLRYHADQLRLPSEAEREGVAVLRTCWITGVQNAEPVASKVAAALYVGARLAKAPLTLRGAIAQVPGADRTTTARQFLRLQATLPAPLPRFQHAALLEQSLTRLAQKRGLSAPAARDLVKIALQLLGFCRRHITEDIVNNHTAACALLACEVTLHEAPCEALLQEIGILVAFDHTRAHFRRPILAALADAAALLPSSALLATQSVVQRCPQILDLDECLHG